METGWTSTIRRHCTGYKYCRTRSTTTASTCTTTPVRTKIQGMSYVIPFPEFSSLHSSTLNLYLYLYRLLLPVIRKLKQQLNHVERIDIFPGRLLRWRWDRKITSGPPKVWQITVSKWSDQSKISLLRDRHKCIVIYAQSERMRRMNVSYKHPLWHTMRNEYLIMRVYAYTIVARLLVGQELYIIRNTFHFAMKYNGSKLIYDPAHLSFTTPASNTESTEYTRSKLINLLAILLIK